MRARRLFTRGKPLAPNTLWVGEQAPGWWHAEDQTHALSYGYWPSYNKALYPGTAARVGQDALVQRFGNYYSYSLTPRARLSHGTSNAMEGRVAGAVAPPPPYLRQTAVATAQAMTAAAAMDVRVCEPWLAGAGAEIFRRDQGEVADEAGMRHILRYNQFQTDPLANHSACNQLACRGDLLPSPRASGAVNAKFTSSSRLAKGQMLFVAGPTHDDQPVFVWSKAPPAVQKEPHIGQPDAMPFEWDVYS